jgi:hypothetical protein
MTDPDLPSALRAELRSDRYELDLSSEAVLSALEQRARRRSRNGRLLVVAAATGAAAAVIVAAFAVVSGAGPDRTDQPAGQPTPTSTPAGDAEQPPAVGGHPVRGVPPELGEAPDPQVAMRAEPALAVVPATGEAIAFEQRSGPEPGGVRRVVVVANPEETVGLVGAVQQPEWARSSSLGGIRALVTDHEPSQTAYLMAFSPTGMRWFVAVTAADRDDRLETMRAVAAGTLPGT